jgi:tetratricopeptide (TPR) repeat protein
MAQKHYREAEPFLRRSLEIRRKELPAGHSELGKAEMSLAECLAELGRTPEAASLLREAYAIFSASGSPGKSAARDAQTLLARIERRR